MVWPNPTQGAGGVSFMSHMATFDIYYETNDDFSVRRSLFPHVAELIIIVLFVPSNDSIHVLGG